MPFRHSVPSFVNLYLWKANRWYAVESYLRVSSDGRNWSAGRRLHGLRQIHGRREDVRWSHQLQMRWAPLADWPCLEIVTHPPVLDAVAATAPLVCTETKHLPPPRKKSQFPPSQKFNLQFKCDFFVFIIFSLYSVFHLTELLFCRNCAVTNHT